jgi:pyrroline-5-carboxylate reductase
MSRLALLGGGKMGEALLGGLVDAGWAPEDLAVAEPVPNAATSWRDVSQGAGGAGSGLGRGRGRRRGGGGETGRRARALESAASALTPGTLVVSIAAGVTLATLEALVPGYPVVRAMPNTPALVRRGAAAIAPGSHAGEEHLTRTERILAAVGTVTRVPEALLDAVTGLSGSGPAYVFLLAEALIDAGVGVGLPRPVAQALVIQTLLGSATLLAEGPEGPEALRAAVTSPGGTTAAGLAALESRAVRAAFLEAVAAATERSRALGQDQR